MINERQRPQLVVYDITLNFNLLQGEDNHKYLTWLKAHYDREGIVDIFTSVDKTEKYKMMSRLYRYNSRFIELTMDCFGPAQNTRADGFSPLKGEFNKSMIKSNIEVPLEYEYDCLKMEYMRQIIQMAGKKNVVFVVSPSWYGLDPK